MKNSTSTYLTEGEYSVDPNSLDTEWVRQASLYQKIAKRAAQAAYSKNRIEAFLDWDIRNSPGKYGFDSKPTEAAVANAVKGNKLFLKALYKYLRLQGELKALEHKKKSLEKLTELYLSGYWARPKIKTEAQELYAEEANRSMLDSLKKDTRLAALRDRRKRES
ncbi:MAG: hypothetical protein EHM49_00480 [Deltaproteobacteria bacterium]|nr:MAG: hypothetical protein EHM49_00480 [Deltaproteobacteria bacterium]